MSRRNFTAICLLALFEFLIASPLSHAQGNSGNGGVTFLEPGQPPVVVHATVEGMKRSNQGNGNAGRQSGGGSELSYHGGTGGIGVETAPKIYLVFWGSQWNNNDPSGEAGILQSFYTGVGGSSWLSSVTQYCEGAARGAVSCNGSDTPAGNQPGLLSGYWYDKATAAPSRPRQSDIAAEAVRAAAYFGHTAAGDNVNVQYVIATAHGNNATGFGSQYCAWHSATSSASGNIAYTNLPYMTDAGASCGANFNGLGPTAGITIVSGHEMAETITDPFPSTGWLDSNGAENGDKCAWISSGQGASAAIKLSTGTFPVQSLWSNAFNGSGGCVITYP
jgi:serine protease